MYEIASNYNYPSKITNNYFPHHFLKMFEKTFIQTNFYTYSNIFTFVGKVIEKLNQNQNDSRKRLCFL